MPAFDLLEPIMTIAREWTGKTVSDFNAIERALVKERDKAIIEALNKIEGRDISEAPLNDRLEELALFTETASDIISKFSNHLESYVKNDFIGDWRKRLKDEISPESVTLREPILDALEAKVSVKLIPAGWKIRWYRIWYRLREYASRLKNPDATFYRFGRKYDLISFTDHFIAFPIAQFLLSEWKKRISNILHDTLSRHEEFLAFEDGVLLSDQLEGDQLYWEKLQSKTLEDGIVALSVACKKGQKSIESREKESAERLQEFHLWLIQDLSEKTLVAGSYILPNGSFSKRKNRQQWQRLLGKIAGDREKRVASAATHTNDWQKDVELANLRVQTTLSAVELVSESEKKLGEHIRPLYKSAYAFLERSISQIEKASDKRLGEELRKEDVHLLDHFGKNFIPDTLETMDRAVFPGMLEESADQVRLFFSNAATDPSLFDFEDGTTQQLSGPPGKPASFRDILLKEALVEHYNEILLEKEKLTKIQESCSRDLLAVTDSIDYHLGIAHNLVSTGSEGESRAVIVEGLHRVLHKLDEIYSRLETGVLEAGNKLQNEYQQICKNLVEMREGNTFIGTHLQFTITKMRIAAEGKRKSRWENSLKRVKNSARRWKRTFVLLGAVFFPTERQDLPEKEKKTRFINRLNAASKHIDQLPFIYRKLFSPEPMEDSRLFLGRESEIGSIKEAIQMFINGHDSSVAITGEPGCGKTSILWRLMIQTKQDWRYLSFSNRTTEEKEVALLLGKAVLGKKTIDLASFEKQLLADDTYRFVILDDLQNLFLREIDGFDLLEKLLAIIKTTSKKVFWVVSVDHFSWSLLESVIGVSDFFVKRITVSNFNRTMLKQALKRRNQISGYNLVFNPKNDARNSRNYEYLESEQEKRTYNEDVYFSDLMAYSRGNIRLALILWLNSIVDFRGDKLIVNPLIVPGAGYLDDLQPQELFSLAAILEHGFLSAEQHATILNLDEDEGIKRLEKLRGKAILEKRELNYAPHPALFQTIIDKLKTNNILSG